MKNGATLWRFPEVLKLLISSDLRRLRNFAARIGRWGEEAAADYLENAGYEILCRNWRAPRNLGELDVVCRDDAGTLCIVEVKTRRWRSTNLPRPQPILAVDPDKRRNLRRAVSAYLHTLGNPRIPLRYDVIEVWANNSGTPTMLRHWTDLFAGTPRYLLPKG